MVEYFHILPKTNTIQRLLLLIITFSVFSMVSVGCQNNRNLFNNKKLDYPLTYPVQRSAAVATHYQNSPAWSTMNPNLLFSCASYANKNSSAENYLRENWPNSSSATGYTTHYESISYRERMDLRYIDYGRSRPRNTLHHEIRGYRWVRQTNNHN